MRLTRLLALFGPAWIIMMADVDASSVITAVSNGEIYGYGLIYLLLILSIPLFIIQDAMGRIGAALPGYGFGDIIRMKFSRKIALSASIPMFITDIFTYVVEYAGIGTGFLLVGIPLYISLPSIFLVHLSILLLKEYRRIEKPLILLSFLLPLAFLSELILRGTDHLRLSSLFYFSTSHSYAFFIAANVGAVIMPFMLFYQSSATSYKYKMENIKPEHGIPWVRKETLAGAVISELIMVVIEMGTTGIGNVKNILNAQDISQSLTAIAGSFSPLFFGAGLIISGFIALVTISLGSSWGTLESLGKYSDRNVVILYVFESLPAIIITVIFSSNFSIVNFVLYLMSLSPLILIIPGIMGGIIVSSKTLLGKYAYGKIMSMVYWVTLFLLISSGIISLI